MAPVGRGGAKDLRAGHVEWPTLILAALIYGLWGVLTLAYEKIPWPMLLMMGGWVTAWHGSLQHEIIHGHPTRSRVANTVIGYAPLSLWLPFEVYRRSHLAHHATEHLTDPAHDPEARYLPVSASRFQRSAAAVQSTLLGRLLLGPAIQIVCFLLAEADRIRRGEPGRAGLWFRHGLAAAVVLGWLILVCHMPLWLYLACFVYPGTALSLLRSYAEHRADPLPRHRVAVVEHAPVLGLLFLHNNLHVVHHEQPGAPWYRLPGLYARDRDRVLSLNGGLVYDGYAEIARRYLFRPHDTITQPQVGGAAT